MKTISFLLAIVAFNAQGQPVAGFADGTSAAARFNGPRGVATDDRGNVYVADYYNHTIRKITTAGMVTTFGGSPGLAGSADGVGSVARFNYPEGVATDSDGNVYVADTGNHAIRKINTEGIVTTVAGLARHSGSADGPLASATFNSPAGIATDRSGNVYVADSLNRIIRKISRQGRVTTLAGSAGIAGNADGIGSAARFQFPQGIAIDNDGNVFVADTFNNTVRKITPEGEVTTLAGKAGFFATGSVDGIGRAARFNNPTGIATDSAGNLYVADWVNATIRKITPTGLVSTLAGSPSLPKSREGGRCCNVDGAGNVARFAGPFGVATDSHGNIYVADTFSHTVRKINAAGETTTIAGPSAAPPK